MKYQVELKLFTAAALAALDGAPEAAGIGVEARAALATSTDDITRSRLRRLTELTSVAQP